MGEVYGEGVGGPCVCVSVCVCVGLWGALKRKREIFIQRSFFSWFHLNFIVPLLLLRSSLSVCVCMHTHTCAFETAARRL